MFTPLHGLPAAVALAPAVVLVASVGLWLALAPVALFVSNLRPLWKWLGRMVNGGLVLRKPGVYDSLWHQSAPSTPPSRTLKNDPVPMTTWGRMAGRKRMAVRWAVAAYCLLVTLLPWVMLAVTVLLAGLLTWTRARRELHNWCYDKVAGNLAEPIAKILEVEDPDPATWMAIPSPRLTWMPVVVPPKVLQWARKVNEKLERRLGALTVPVVRVPLEDDEATITMSYPAGLSSPTAIKQVTEIATARLPDGPWTAVNHAAQLQIELKHPKRPPSEVWYTEDALEAHDWTAVPVGKNASKEWVVLPLASLAPHTIMSATTGWGKTEFAYVYIAHMLANGARVMANDPKRLSFHKVFGKVPTFDVKVTAEGWIVHTDEFLGEMEHRYELMEEYPEIQAAPHLYFQPWVLLTDERGSYVSDLKSRWKAEGGKGLPPTLTKEKKVLWQARAAGMFVCDLAQQANLEVFVDSDGRDQRMARIASGPQSPSASRMMFPGVGRIKVPSKKGRAILGIGVDEVSEIQMARIDHAYAETISMRGAALAEKENAEREERLQALMSGSVLPVSDPDGAAETPASVPGQRADTAEADTATRANLTVIAGGRGNGDQDNSTDNSSDVQTATGNDVSGDAGADTEKADDELIIGLQAAADFLEMTKANFEKTRQRRPIQGETRDGMSPAWRPLDLTEWRRQQPRAGRDAA